MKEELNDLKIGDSLNAPLSLEASKSLIDKFDLNKRFKLIEIDGENTTIVRLRNKESIKSKILEAIESKDIYAGCYIKGNHKYIKRVLSFIDLDLICLDLGEKTYIHKEIDLDESIDLDDYKLISIAFEKKLEELQSKIE